MSSISRKPSLDDRRAQLVYAALQAAALLGLTVALVLAAAPQTVPTARAVTAAPASPVAVAATSAVPASPATPVAPAAPAVR